MNIGFSRGVNKMGALKENKQGLSTNDLRLKKYMELQQLIKEATKELSEIKDEIKHSGGISTRNYVATVSTQERTLAPTTKELVEIYGLEAKKHFKTTVIEIVKVSKRGGQ